MQQIFDQYFHDRKLKLLLTADCPHWGAPPSRTSFVFDSMLRLSYFLGNYYPRGGSQAFADELAQRFEEQGGQILMRSLVTRILVDDHRAYGVEVETGPARQRRTERVQAQWVVSNGDLLRTYETMIDAPYVDPSYVASLRRLRPTYPCFLSHIGLRDVPTEILRDAHGYYWDDWNTDFVGRHALRCKVFVPTLYESGLSRDGGHIIIIQKVMELDYEAIEDWAAHKASVEAYVTEHLKRIIPDFEHHVVVQLSASAHTSYRYTLNHRGAMLGWEMAPDQLGHFRSGIVGPIDRLAFVGHWAQPGGGITPVIVSAMRVAQKITMARPAPLVTPQVLIPHVCWRGVMILWT